MRTPAVLKLIQNALVLFFRGKLIRDPVYFARQLAIGSAATAVLFLICCLLLRLPVIAALIAGFAGGALQTYLFEDVKYQ
jgi:hypothetical protein